MKNNFSKLNLLRNKGFYFVGSHNKKIYFKVPTLDDYIADEAMIQFFSIMQVPLESLEIQAQVKNKLELLLYLIKSGLYLEEIVATLHKLVTNIKVNTTGLFVDSHQLSVNELEWLLDSWLISLGVKTFDEQEEPPAEGEDVLSEMDRKIRESEAKIRKIKQKRKEQTEEPKFSLENILAAVIKEFHFKMDEVLAMNMYTVFWYYNMALRYNNYRIETIAYGNGLIKKHKYFIE